MSTAAKSNFQDSDKIVQKSSGNVKRLTFPRVEDFYNGGDEEPNTDAETVRRMEEIAREALVNCDDEEIQPQNVLYFGGVATSSLGNFSLVTGKAKSKKTFAVVMVMAALLSGRSINKILGALTDKKLCIWFDTEQSRYHVQRAFKTAIKLAGGQTEKMPLVFSLRKYNRKERLAFINYTLSLYEDLAFVVIDGIRDLVSDINDPDQATEISDWLLKVSEERNIHICTILHLNKSDSNARGHLGTELVNKAQTVFVVERDTNDKSISTVKTSDTRDTDIEPLAFKINDEGLPVLLDDYIQPIEVKVNKRKSFDLSLDLHKRIAEDIFSKQKQLTARKLVIQIKLSFEAINQKVSEATAREYVQHWENNQIIKDISDEGQQAKKFIFFETV